MMHACRKSTGETKAGKLTRVRGQPVLHSEILSQKKINTMQAKNNVMYSIWNHGVFLIVIMALLLHMFDKTCRTTGVLNLEAHQGYRARPCCTRKQNLGQWDGSARKNTFHTKGLCVCLHSHTHRTHTIIMKFCNLQNNTWNLGIYQI